MDDRPDRLEKKLRNHDSRVEVERSGICGRCGMRISNTTSGHGPLGGATCMGKPDHGWRYRAIVTIGGYVYKASEFPSLKDKIARMMAEAKREKETVWEWNRGQKKAADAR